jgi:hypothetical protein
VATPRVQVAGSSYGFLTGVAASSAGSAWAVGFTGGDDGFILGWNGSRW